MQVTKWERVHTAVIGAGQAGLAMSYCLRQQGTEHVVLEARDRVASTWRKRWDSFCLVTPNWMCQLPGFPYDGDDPDGFMSRDELLAFFERYSQSIVAPVRFNTQVTALRRKETGDGYQVETTAGAIEATNVVVASGAFQSPRTPPVASAMPAACFQVHSDAYRSPDQLPAGAVLVVGSGQSGAQIAEDLHRAGRHVYLCVSRCGRQPFRYRGQTMSRWFFQMFTWAMQNGVPQKTVADLPSPRAKFACNPIASGRDGGHELNLRAFGSGGIALLGGLQGVADGKIQLKGDLRENLRAADEFASNMVREIDGFIDKTGLQVPPDTLSKVDFEPAELSELDLNAEGINSIVWATGYRLDFGWVEMPVFDEDGYPVQDWGMTRFPGLYFIGLQWLHAMGSSLIVGVGRDAAHIADAIVSRQTVPA